jgi:nitrile hydratase
MTPDVNREHDHQAVPSDPALRAKALESLRVEKGHVDPAALDVLVARAWNDPAYKQRLLDDGTAAMAELGFTGDQGEKLTVVENTPTVHNVIVCTLCSCYPWPLLGLPPIWYKSNAYRSRTVVDPRGVLRELGLAVADDVEMRVWDSTATSRYLVLPERPVGTESLTEDELAELVTRDAMIGVARVRAPGDRA